MDSSGRMNVLFVGKERSGVCWYRCALPALHLGADWCGVADRLGDRLRFVTGGMSRPMTHDSLFEYDVVVLQQPRGARWAKLMQELRAAGITVLYEIDDDLHAVGKKNDHDFKEHFTREFLREVELAIDAADGIITSTPYLGQRMRRFHDRVWVCENGIDLTRYALSPAPHEGVVVGWAGGTGHLNAMVPWLRELDGLMYERPDVRFTSVGQPFANLLQEHHGPERCVSIPFHTLETYPATMTGFDIALAPAGRTNFYKAKSDLRWLEAGALGLPVIADPVVYPHIEHGVTGFHAETAAEAGALMRELTADAQLRRRVGEAARAHIRATRDMRAAAEQWRRVFAEVSAPAGAAAR